MEKTGKLVIGNRTCVLVGSKMKRNLRGKSRKITKRIFGDETVYFDIKKGVKSKEGSILPIPDGYLISFSGTRPRLYCGK